MFNPYDRNSFIERIKDLDRTEMINEAAREVREIESQSYRARGAVEARRQGSVQYAEFLKGLLYFLRYGDRPSGLNDWDFQLLYPLCKNLVEKNNFKQELLNLFED